MYKYLILVGILFCSNAYAEETYTNADILKMMNEPGTMSYATPAKAVRKHRANPGGIINCTEAVENQTGQINIGHAETCIEVPQSYSNRALVRAYWGSDKDGYYRIKDDTTLDMSKWKKNIDN